jgi:hypothetical protein
VPVHRLNGDRDIEVVQKEILKELGR